MTVEKIIEIYNDLDRIGGIILKGNSEEETKYNAETIEAMQGINVILHKYQKILKIMDELDGNFYGSYLKDRQALDKIYEVLEDGRN